MNRKPFVQPFPKPAPPRKTRDPYLYALIWQTVLCVLIVACGFVLREARPELWMELKPIYEGMLLSDMPDSGFQQLADDVITAVRRTAGEVSQRMVHASQPPDAAADETEATQMAGMGGSGAPEGCTLSPVLLSSLVEPPIGGRVTSGFGWRDHPITEKRDFHRGMDIAGASGSPIHAALPGVVVETGESPIYGNYIRLDHGHGLQTAYSHCEAIVAQTGENLRKGELLGTVGSTGVSTGPHVHFEILVNGIYYNPEWVMDVRHDGD